MCLGALLCEPANIYELLNLAAALTMSVSSRLFLLHADDKKKEEEEEGDRTHAHMTHVVYACLFVASLRPYLMY